MYYLRNSDFRIVLEYVYNVYVILFPFTCATQYRKQKNSKQEPDLTTSLKQNRIPVSIKLQSNRKQILKMLHE